MKTIYNVYVPMESQEQCDRMKQLCIDNKIKIFASKSAFDFKKDENCFFRYTHIGKDFYISIYKHELTQVTEQEFIELLKNTKL